MKQDVAVVDYGLGNLHSVVKALEFSGATVRIAEKGSDLSNASHVILPGVGALSDGMRGLSERGHDAAIREYVSKGGNLLGICLGAQLLLGESEEFGVTTGLNIIPGRVLPIPSQGVKVPLVGWRKLQASRADAWKGTMMEEIPEGVWAYFIHSYHAVPDQAKDLMAVCSHGEHAVHAIVRRDNVIGCQFHPEKSGQWGIKMLQAFLNLK